MGHAQIVHMQWTQKKLFLELSTALVVSCSHGSCDYSKSLNAKK